ncbi:MAG: hypothetical protein HY652_12090 [Acidobacteria bacterium]|nr:hypothetical protein [Acidobacteriota bacterium]
MSERLVVTGDAPLVNTTHATVPTVIPVKSFLDVGVKPSLEWGGGQPEGLSSAPWNLEKLITRKDEAGKVWGAHEKIDRKQALCMMTNWSSYYTSERKMLGTIEVRNVGRFRRAQRRLPDGP